MFFSNKYSANGTIVSRLGSQDLVKQGVLVYALSDWPAKIPYLDLTKGGEHSKVDCFQFA